MGHLGPVTQERIRQQLGWSVRSHTERIERLTFRLTHVLLHQHERVGMLRRLSQSRSAKLRAAAALQRLEFGTYGRCTECGSPIERLRLKRDPTTDHCRSCHDRNHRR